MLSAPGVEMAGGMPLPLTTPAFYNPMQNKFSKTNSRQAVDSTGVDIIFGMAVGQPVDSTWVENIFGMAGGMP